MSFNSNDIKANPIQFASKCTALSLPEPTEYVVRVKKKSFIESLPDRIPAFGLFCALIGVTMFSLASLIVKVLTEMHSVEVLIFRCVVQFIPYFLITVKKKYPIFGMPGHRIDLGLRCISGTISLITLYMAYRMIPLSDASTIYLSSPVFVTIFAYILLKEPITIVQGVTGTITVIGVFVISKPEFIFGQNESATDKIYEHRIVGIILSVVAAVSSACSLINLRKLKSTPVPVIVMWYSLTVVIIGSGVLPFLDKWVAPSGAYTWLMLLAIGAAGTLNQFFQTTAFKYESAGPISVTRSFNIVLSFIWEVAIFAEPVDYTSIVGACLISGCVVIIALNKCNQENPEKFRAFFRSIFCFCCNNNKGEDNLKSVPDSMRTSIESLDQNLTINSTNPIIHI